jgi:hypothetical protein
MHVIKTIVSLCFTLFLCHNHARTCCKQEKLTFSSFALVEVQFPCIIKHSNIKACQEVGELFHAFRNLTLDPEEWSLLHSQMPYPRGIILIEYGAWWAPKLVWPTEKAKSLLRIKPKLSDHSAYI